MTLNRKYLILWAHILLLLLYRFWGYSGHFGYDDIEYARLASSLLDGSIESDNHFFYRWSIIFPTGLSYWIFGVGDFASSIPPIVAASLTLYFVFKLLKDQSTSTLWMALSITTTAQWFLFYSNKLMADIYICMAFTMSIYFLYRLWFYAKESEWKYALYFCLSMFIGFLAKGTIVFMLPVIVYALLVDFIQKRHFKFWISCASFGSAILLIYLFTIYLISGDPMSRFDAIASNGYLNKCSYGAQSVAILFKRVFIDFFGMIRNEGFALFVIIAILPLFVHPKRILSGKSKIAFMISIASVLFFSANFMSISLTSYNPMCIDFRHYLFIVPPIAMAASKVINSDDFHHRYSMIILVLTSILLYSSWSSVGISFHFIYLPLWLFFILNHLTKNSLFKRSPILYALFFSTILLAFPIRTTLHARAYNYPKQQELILDKIHELNDSLFIFTDDIQARIGNYQLGFDSSRVQFVDYDALKKHHLKSKRSKGILINPNTQFLMYTGRNQRPYYYDHAIKYYEADTLNRQLKLKYYNLSRIVEPPLNGRPLLSSLNDFTPSKKLDYWKGEITALDSNQSNSVPSSNKVEQYSYTFTLNIDSIQLKPKESLYISTSLQTRLSKNLDCKLIFSVESNKDVYLYEAIDLNPFQNVYTHWWKVSGYATLPFEQIQPNSLLKVYVWNQSSESIHVDDFNIELFGFYP